MSDPKRHHYVPEMLQGRFVNERGMLYYINKDYPKKGIGKTGPGNLFVKNNLHTAYKENGTRDTTLERSYSKIEGKADRIISKIVASARDGRPPNLTVVEKKEWDHFVFFQWKRVPDCHNALYESFDDDLKVLKDLFEKERRPLTNDERTLFDDAKWKSRLRQNARVQALGRGSEAAVEVLNSRGLGVAIITLPNKSFVLGSFPVVKLTTPGATHLGHPNVELWLPVASDVAVTPFGDRGEERLVRLADQRSVRRLNEAIFRQSTIVAGSSRALIASLACKVME